MNSGNGVGGMTMRVRDGDSVRGLLAGGPGRGVETTVISTMWRLLMVAHSLRGGYFCIFGYVAEVRGDVDIVNMRIDWHRTDKGVSYFKNL